MRYIKAKIKYGDQYWDTYLEINGEEKNVRVNYESSADEPDVNYFGCVEINSVILEGTEWDVLPLMNAEERDHLQMRVEEHENDRHDPSNYGDF